MTSSALRLQLAGEPTWVGMSGRPTLADRAAAYASRFPQCPNSVWVAGDKGQWLYGVWQTGSDYRNRSTYYGAYPHRYLDQVLALFPEIAPHEILHVFSGSLPAGEYTRLDMNPSLGAELLGTVYDVAALTPRRFKLVIADPPYTAADAAKYGTPPLNRGRATAALARVTCRGGHLVWLDTTWPMHRKDQWHYYGAIEIRRSTNHRLRGVSLFERKAS